MPLPDLDFCNGTSRNIASARLEPCGDLLLRKSCTLAEGSYIFTDLLFNNRVHNNSSHLFKNKLPDIIIDVWYY